MAIPTFGITAAKVISLLPIDRSEVTEDTELKPSDIEGYIDDNAAKFCGLLQQGGIDPEDIDDAITERQAGVYVQFASVADALDQMGGSTRAGYERYRTRSDEIFKQYASRPETLNKRVTRARYTGDTSLPPSRDFTGRNYEF